jgi:hypothetical protein
VTSVGILGKLKGEITFGGNFYPHIQSSSGVFKYYLPTKYVMTKEKGADLQFSFHQLLHFQ